MRPHQCRAKDHYSCLGQTNRRLDASSPVEMGVTTNVGLAAAPDDSVLINLVLTGNAECFGALMNRHLAAVRGCIRGMTRSVSDADDIMQEVQLKIWRRLGSSGRRPASEPG
jgi:Sigma-70 region 2